MSSKNSSPDNSYAQERADFECVDDAEPNLVANESSWIPPGQFVATPRSETSRTIYEKIVFAIRNKRRSVVIGVKSFLLDHKGKAEGIEGCMNSCKTDELIRHLELRKLGNCKILAAKPHTDTRTEGIVSKTGAQIENVVVFKDILSDYFLEYCIQAEEIGIDEGQFVANLRDFIVIMTAIGINVTVCFLSSTYDMTSFKNVEKFRPVLNRSTYYSAICANCPHGKGREANFSCLLEKPKGEIVGSILVGGSEKYASYCRACFMDQNGDAVLDSIAE